MRCFSLWAADNFASFTLLFINDLFIQYLTLTNFKW